jgi:formylglycine-generating enzyme required for sulfatase activity
MINKANTAGGLGITMADMSTYVGGNFASRAATGISWNEAARFVNYLNTSKGYQAAYNFTTGGSNDNITLWGAGQYSGSNRFRHKDAVFVLPSLDEWYKGAYGSSGGTWYDFATGSNSRNSGPGYTNPTSVISGTAAGSAVYSRAPLQGPADVTLAGGLSSYGTMGQGGNVWEWSETAFDRVNDSAGEAREFRGGSWTSSWEEIESLSRIPFNNETTRGGSTTAQNDYGFRVAMVPEPSALSLLAVGLGGLAMMRRRRS